MTVGWNFERRRITCAKFSVGVLLIAKGKAGFETSLETVRSRMRLPPEDALFAARRLCEDGLLELEPGGIVRSNAAGVAQAEELLRVATAKARAFDDVARTLAGGGVALEMLRLAMQANGGRLDCGAPESDAVGSYRLALTGDEIVVERQGEDGAYAEVEPP